MDLQHADSEVEDEYYMAYINARNELMQCHVARNLKSCLSCQELLSCPIRLKYVESVYGNMTKGAEGSFDFN